MRISSYRPFLLMALVLFLLLTLPWRTVQVGRSATVSMAGFVQRWMRNGVEFVCGPFSYTRLWISATPYRTEVELKASLHEARLESMELRRRIRELREILEQEVLLDGLEGEALSLEQALEGYRKDRLALAQQVMQMVPAKVVFRSPSTWESSVWVNVGEATNRRLNRSVVQKHSPVLIGEALVGVIDYVGEQQSRVALITDSQVIPSVRAVRGGIADEHLRSQVAHLKEIIALTHPDEPAIGSLEQLEESLRSRRPSLFLAKGEIHGKGRPLWRCRSDRLWGSGFNYETADGYGPARDLRSGLPHDQVAGEAIPLIDRGDLLVTTGMDGVFPAGIQVGRVLSVGVLKEGGYAYDIEAIPVVSQLHDLSTVFVIPPVPFEEARRG